MDKNLSFYSQNFDGLPASGSAVWESGGNFFPGWTVARTVAGNAIVANNGSSNIGNLYSYGTTGNTERALGSVSTGLASRGEYAYGLLLQNNTGDVITEIDLSYIGEQWRVGELAAMEQKLTFWYAIKSDKNFNLSPSSDLGWVAVKNLDFASPIFGLNGTNLNGNLGANRRQLNQTLIVNIPAGHYLMLRWKDADDMFADHGLAVDEFSIAWRNAPKPSKVLPVELSKFVVKSVDRQVKLEWETASERDNDYFAIERSSDGHHFTELTTIKGKGTTAFLSTYSFTDTNPIIGTSYYRLKQVDYSQAFEYSKVIDIHFKDDAEVVMVYPTIVTELLTVSGQEVDQQNEIRIIDSSGKQVLTSRVMGTLFTINISSLKAGFYTIIIPLNTDKVISRKFRKT